MREFRDAIQDIFISPTENFAAYLAALDPPKTCKILEHGLDVLSAKDSTDFPHLVLGAEPDRILRSIAGHPAKGQLRKGKLSIFVAIRRDVKSGGELTYESFNDARNAAEELMVNVVMYLESKFALIASSGFANMRYRDDEDNWLTVATQICGVESVMGVLRFESEYEWQMNRIYKNITLSPRR